MSVSSRRSTAKSPQGEGRIVGEPDSPTKAIGFAGAFGANADRWVNQGVIDDEYGDEVVTWSSY